MTWSAAGSLSTAASFSAGPMVRIRFPPAESLRTIGSSNFLVGSERLKDNRRMRDAANAYPVARFAQAAFEHVAHTEFGADLLHVDRAASVGE